MTQHNRQKYSNNSLPCIVDVADVINESSNESTRVAVTETGSLSFNIRTVIDCFTPDRNTAGATIR